MWTLPRVFFSRPGGGGGGSEPYPDTQGRELAFGFSGFRAKKREDPPQAPLNRKYLALPHNGFFPRTVFFRPSVTVLSGNIQTVKEAQSGDFHFPGGGGDRCAVQPERGVSDGRDCVPREVASPERRW